MDDKITHVSTESGKMKVTMKNGEQCDVLAKTIYTHYQSGRKDCHIQIEDVINGESRIQK